MAKKCNNTSDVMLLHPPHEDVEQEKQQEHDLNRDADRTNDQKMMNIELLP